MGEQVRSDNTLQWKLTIEYVHHSEERQRQGWLATASTTTDPNLQKKARCYLLIERSYKSDVQSFWESWTGLPYWWVERSFPMASGRHQGKNQNSTASTLLFSASQHPEDLTQDHFWNFSILTWTPMMLYAEMWDILAFLLSSSLVFI